VQGTARNDDALVDDRLVITVLVGCLLFLGVGVSQLSVDHTRGAVPASAFALATAGVLGVVTLVLWRWPGVITPRNAVWAVALTAIVVGANPVVYIVCTGIAYPSVGTLLVIVGIGALVPYPRVAAGLILILNVIAVLCAIRYPQSASVGMVAMQLLKADLLAVIIAVTWRRTERRLRDANETIRQMAVTDDMTDLLNRRGFTERGGRYLNDAEHRGRHLLLAFVDIDGLKQINDSQGHAAGDVTITAVGESLHWVLDNGGCGRAHRRRRVRGADGRRRRRRRPRPANPTRAAAAGDRPPGDGRLGASRAGVFRHPGITHRRVGPDDAVPETVESRVLIRTVEIRRSARSPTPRPSTC
jgi:hypothetical protein